MPSVKVRVIEIEGEAEDVVPLLAGAFGSRKPEALRELAGPAEPARAPDEPDADPPHATMTTAASTDESATPAPAVQQPPAPEPSTDIAEASATARQASRARRRDTNPDLATATAATTPSGKRQIEPDNAARHARRGYCPLCHAHVASKVHRACREAQGATLAAGVNDPPAPVNDRPADRPAPASSVNDPAPAVNGKGKPLVCGRCRGPHITSEHDARQHDDPPPIPHCPAHPGRNHHFAFENATGPISRGACVLGECTVTKWAGNSAEASARLAAGDDPATILAEWEAAMAPDPI